MHPANFAESNKVLSKPDEMTDDECGPLCVCQAFQGDLPVNISCWKPTKAELTEIISTGRVWVGVIGPAMPPIWVSGHKPAFKVSDNVPDGQ